MRATTTLLLVCAAACNATEAPPASPSEITASGPLRIEEDSDGLRVFIGEELFCAYDRRNELRPILWPVNGPSGAAVTRAYPQTEAAPGEASDHPHHQAVWYGHGAVNGHDFWHAGHGERVVDLGDMEVEGPQEEGVLSRGFLMSWQVKGEELCQEERVMRFYGTSEERWVDFEVTLHANQTELQFGDTKEGTFAVRLAPTLRLKGPVAAGSIRNSAGDTGGKTWGKRAAWVEYSGPVGGETVYVSLHDHSSNLRHPTWWHARDYGLLAANPFGIHDFEREPAGTGDFTLPKGERLTQRYSLRVASTPLSE